MNHLPFLALIVANSVKLQLTELLLVQHTHTNTLTKLVTTHFVKNESKKGLHSLKFSKNTVRALSL